LLARGLFGCSASPGHGPPGRPRRWGPSDAYGCATWRRPQGCANCAPCPAARWPRPPVLDFNRSDSGPRGPVPSTARSSASIWQSVVPPRAGLAARAVNAYLENQPGALPDRTRAGALALGSAGFAFARHRPVAGGLMVCFQAGRLQPSEKRQHAFPGHHHQLEPVLAEQGCLLRSPIQTEKGAGTMSPHTVLRGRSDRNPGRWPNPSPCRVPPTAATANNPTRAPALIPVPGVDSSHPPMASRTP